MSAYNPGTGWRAADQQDDVRDCIAYWDAETRTWNHWVREAPVPALPTAPYTVIRVTEWSGGGRAFADLMLRTDGTWYDDAIGRTLTNPEAISSFEVLSEPRGVTAKAVLGRLLNRLDAEGVKVTNIGEWIDMVGREFGVES